MKKKLISLCMCAAFLQGGPVAGNEQKSWYAYGGGGWSNVTYPEGGPSSVGYSRNFTINLDLPGIYYRRSEHGLVGFVVNTFMDRWSRGGEWRQQNSAMFAISTMQFWENRIEQGPFVRLDVGPTLVRPTSSEEEFIGETSDLGVGLLVGVGYGWPITSGTRLLFQVNYGGRRIEGENAGVLNLTLGVMR